MCPVARGQTRRNRIRFNDGRIPIGHRWNRTGKHDIYQTPTKVPRGPVVLSNVTFVNCTFEVDTDDKGTSLLVACLSENVSSANGRRLRICRNAPASMDRFAAVRGGNEFTETGHQNPQPRMTED